MGDEAMPADPFREGQPDWTQFALNNSSFFSAHVAAGLAEPIALELTKEYMRFWLGVILAGQAMQQAPQEPEQPEGM